VVSAQADGGLTVTGFKNAVSRQLAGSQQK